MDEKTRRRSFVRKERAGKREGAAAERPPAEDERRARPEEAAPEPRRERRPRMVIPREERGAPRRTELDVELREIRYGTTARGYYLRAVPSKRRFTKVAPGYIEATRLASQPLGRMARTLALARAALLGSPLAASRAIHERLTKIKALAIIGSDPLSSSAYATEEALIILALAGAAAFVYATPIGLVVAALLVIVTISYRQTIRAYPSGGGAYTVAHENLGRMPGLTAGAALLVDYVLLVSVSVAAGVAAITSAAPALHDYRVPLAVSIVVLFTLGNLRGVREAGTIFAAPTYFFILAMGTTIVVGVIRVLVGDAPGTLTDAAPPREEVVATQGVTLWLVMRAFSSGSAALTGVEAMANGVPAFKPPESRNARTTLTVMAVIAVCFFVGITFLTSRYGLVPHSEELGFEGEPETIVSQMGRAVLGENALYFAYQAATAGILFLAANTSFNAFPLLSATLSRHRYMPRQFAFRGDRLAYTNGILLLSGIAILLLIAFEASVTRLIPLYALGVFVAFTFSQSGMVKHWLNLREPGWRASLVLNGVGAVATGIVAGIILATRFEHGAWISVLLMGALIAMFLAIYRHYRWFYEAISVDPEELPRGVPRAVRAEPGGPHEHVVVPVDGINKITMGAIGMARELSSMITAVHLTDDVEAAEKFRAQWDQAIPDVPLLIIESPFRAFVAPMVAYVESLARSETDKRILVVLPGFMVRHWWQRLLHNRDVMRLRPLLRVMEGVRVLDFRYDVGAPPTPPSPPAGRPVRVRS